MEKDQGKIVRLGPESVLLSILVLAGFPETAVMQTGMYLPSLYCVRGVGLDMQAKLRAVIILQSRERC